MSDRSYRRIRYDNPKVQAQFEQLVQNVRDAEQARAPIAQQHRQAEDADERGAASNAAFQSADKAYIAANNVIAAAQHAIEAFLSANPNYTA